MFRPRKRGRYTISNTDELALCPFPRMLGKAGMGARAERAIEIVTRAAPSPQPSPVNGRGSERFDKIQ